MATTNKIEWRRINKNDRLFIPMNNLLILFSAIADGGLIETLMENITKQKSPWPASTRFESGSPGLGQALGPRFRGDERVT